MSDLLSWRRDKREVPTTPAHGAIKLLVAHGIVLGSGFLISVILARGLGPVEFGVYGVVMSTLVWLERVLNAGIPRAAVTLLPRHEDQRHVIEQSARTLLLLWSLPLVAVVWLSATDLADVFGIPDGATVIRVAITNIPAISLLYAYEGILGGRRLFNAQSAMHIVQSSAKLTGILLLWVIGLSVTGAFIMHVAATAVTVLYIIIAFPPWGTLPSRKTMAAIVRIALPIGGYSVALTLLTSLSLWQLKGSIGDGAEVVGYYSASLNLTRILLVVPATISVVLFASLSWAFATSQPELVKKYTQETSRFALVALTPACLLLVLDAEDVMRLLYGEDYASGGAILSLLCGAFTLFTFLDIYFHVLMAHGRFAIGALVLGGLIPALILLNMALIPTFRGVGAAAATLAVLGAGAIIATVLAYRQIGALVRLATFVRVSIAGLFIAVLSVASTVTGPLLVIKLAGLTLMYLLVLAITGELTKHDLKTIAVWKSNPAR